jgi:hypothetical protein
MVIDLLELGAFEKCGGGLRVWNALKDALTHHGQVCYIAYPRCVDICAGLLLLTPTVSHMNHPSFTRRRW